MSNPDNGNLCSTGRHLGRLAPGVVNHSDETLSLLCVTFCSTLFGDCSLKEWRSSQTSLEPYLLSTSLYFSDIQARLMLWQKIENIFARQNIIWWPLEHLGGLISSQFISTLPSRTKRLIKSFHFFFYISTPRFVVKDYEKPAFFCLPP